MSIDLLDLVTLWTPFAAEAVDAGPIAANFVAALRARLLSTPELAGLTGVYLSSAATGAPYPRLILNHLWQSPAVNSSRSYWEEVELQYDVFAESDTGAKTLGEAAYASLIWDGDPLRFEGGYEMARNPGNSAGPRIEPGGRVGGAPVWRFHFQFTHMLGKGGG